MPAKSQSRLDGRSLAMTVLVVAVIIALAIADRWPGGTISAVVVTLAITSAMIWRWVRTRT